MPGVKSGLQAEIWQDLKVLRHLLFSRPSGATHAQRIENFYAGQAELYDGFRERLLSGRERLVKLSIPEGFEGTWLDVGAGTGSNLEYALPCFGKRARLVMVDICASLLKVAKERVKRHGLGNVQICQADAATFWQPDLKADIVTFSYSLTMMPDWHATLNNVLGLMSGAGRIAVVDFGFAGQSELSWLSRLEQFFWKSWFSYDGVKLNTDHLDYLRSISRPIVQEQWRAKLPYLPFLKAPSYLYLGQIG